MIRSPSITRFLRGAESSPFLRLALVGVAAYAVLETLWER